MTGFATSWPQLLFERLWWITLPSGYVLTKQTMLSIKWINNLGLATIYSVVYNQDLRENTDSIYKTYLPL